MPVYTYKCNLCSFNDDYIKNIKDRDKKIPCEQEDCSGVMMRDIDAPSFQLKGGGWYKDGYTKKKSEKKESEK